MNWQRKILVFQLKSGLCIGWNDLGFIKRTRWFVPSKNLWAMTTKAVTEYTLVKNISYIQTGEAIDQNIKFTNFYLWTQENDGTWYTPEFKKDTGLCWGKKKNWEFASRFLATQSSTALDMKSTSAKENTLHEVEYIMPLYQKSGERNREVYLIGEMFYREEAFSIESQSISVSDICNKVFTDSSLYLGAESAYGYGRIEYVKLDSDKKIPFPEKIPGIESVTEDGKGLVSCTFKGNEPFPCFLQVNKQSKTQIAGDVEFVVAREWKNCDNSEKKGAGQKVVSHGYFWIPGSIIVDKKEDDFHFSIGKYGFWEEMLS